MAVRSCCDAVAVGLRDPRPELIQAAYVDGNLSAEDQPDLSAILKSQEIYC